MHDINTTKGQTRARHLVMAVCASCSTKSLLRIVATGKTVRVCGSVAVASEPPRTGHCWPYETAWGTEPTTQMPWEHQIAEPHRSGKWSYVLMCATYSVPEKQRSTQRSYHNSQTHKTKVFTITTVRHCRFVNNKGLYTCSLSQTVSHTCDADTY